MNLVVDHQIDMMIEMDDKDLYQYIRTDKDTNTIFNVNKEYIFKKKLFNYFQCTKLYEELYSLIKTMDKNFETYSLETKFCKKYTRCSDDFKTKFDTIMNKARNTNDDTKRDQYKLQACRTLLTCFDSIKKTEENLDKLYDIYGDLPINASGDLGQVANILDRLINNLSDEQQNPSNGDEYPYDGRPYLEDHDIPPVSSFQQIARLTPRRRHESDNIYNARIQDEYQRRATNRRNNLETLGWTFAPPPPTIDLNDMNL